MNELGLLLAMLGVSLAINIAMFLVAYKYKTDKLTDISYAVTFVVLAVVALFIGQSDFMKYVLVAMISVWACRLGGFLLIRVWRTGRDSRFDDMRDDFVKFGRFWVAQAVSVWAILLPSIFVLTGGAMQFGAVAIAGFVIWMVGLMCEATADWQKYRFSQDPANKNKWIATGIWRYSRHPNYFGEIMVWVGVYLFVFASLEGWMLWVGLVSPLFIASLLLFVSGIPILEKSADQRWGNDPKYQAYKRRTSILVPMPPKH